MIETKHIALYGSPKGDRSERKTYEKCQSYIQDMKAFGWQTTEEVTERNGRASQRYQIMARETTMRNYSEYHKYEMEYESAKSKLKTYNSMEFSTILLLFLILIVPGLCYVIFKNIQKVTIKKNNNNCNDQMRAAVTKALGV